MEEEILDIESSLESEIEQTPETEAVAEPMVLRSEHLFKKYGKRTVVNDVSIYVRQGEIVGLLGPNGAGKTTTFYMTTGLVTANSGKIFLNDEEPALGRTARRVAGTHRLPQHGHRGTRQRL